MARLSLEATAPLSTVPADSAGGGENSAGANRAMVNLGGGEGSNTQLLLAELDGLRAECERLRAESAIARTVPPPSAATAVAAAEAAPDVETLSSGLTGVAAATQEMEQELYRMRSRVAELEESVRGNAGKDEQIVELQVCSSCDMYTVCSFTVFGNGSADVLLGLQGQVQALEAKLVDASAAATSAADRILALEAAEAAQTAKLEAMGVNYSEVRCCSFCQRARCANAPAW